MARFKVGDRARVVFGKNKGHECIIVGIDVVSRGMPKVWKDYLIEVPTNPHPKWVTWSCMESSLEPIIEPGSWKEIEKAIKWNPVEKKESVE